MKNIALIMIAAFTSCFSFAQTHNHNFICSYYGEPVSTPVMGFNSAGEADGIVSRIIDVVGLEPKFQLKAANIPNAAAVISSGQRYILFNPNFINAINKAAQNEWASIAILAHEIGHHLNGHTLLGTGSRPAIELEADQFSGFVLRKMGASLSQAQLSMQIVASNHATRTHPAKQDRLASIQSGWNKADYQITGKVPAGSPVVSRTVPASQPVVTRTQPVQPIRTASTTYRLPGKYIRYNLYLDHDPNRYHITTGDNVVTIKKDKLIVVGKMVSTTNTNFPKAIVVDNKVHYYISKNGMVVTSSFKKVGLISRGD